MERREKQGSLALMVNLVMMAGRERKVPWGNRVSLERREMM